MKEPSYFFDLDAVRIPHLSMKKHNVKCKPNKKIRMNHHLRGGRLPPTKDDPHAYHPLGKNPADFWSISPSITRGHTAAFPEKLGELPILARCPEKVCRTCGIPQLKRFVRGPPDPGSKTTKCCKPAGRCEEHSETVKSQTVLGCDCNVGFDPGIVLDPFMGSGTTGIVARKLGRDFIGFELNADYARLARGKLRGVG